jgi:hypothetical protein
VAKAKETPVLGVIVSPIKNHVNIAKTSIPLAKPMNRPGQRRPSKCSTAYAVALIKR